MQHEFVTRIDIDVPAAYAWGVPGMPFLLDVHQGFRIESLSDDRCRFHCGECFRGIILNPLWPQIAKRAADGYDGFNLAFKQRCEALHR